MEENWRKCSIFAQRHYRIINVSKISNIAHRSIAERRLTAKRRPMKVHRESVSAGARKSVACAREAGGYRWLQAVTGPSRVGVPSDASNGRLFLSLSLSFAVRGVAPLRLAGDSCGSTPNMPRPGVRFRGVTDLSRGNLSCAVPENEPQTRSIPSVSFGAASPRSSADESEQARGRERKRRLRINTAKRASVEAILTGAENTMVAMITTIEGAKEVLKNIRESLSDL